MGKGMRGLVGALVAATVVWGGGPPELGAQPTGSVVYLVRHAETRPDEASPSDPPLSDEGRARAAELVRVVPAALLTSVHSTAFRRTEGTAGAVAEAAGLTVRSYDPLDRDALNRLVSELRSTPGHHLVVGHSNTTPDLVRRLGGDPVAPIEETEYDRLYVVTNRGGEAGSALLRYGAPSEGVAPLPEPSFPDPSRVREETLTFVMSFQGDSAGTSVFETRRDGDGWVLTETSTLAGFDVEAVNQARIAPSLHLRRFEARGTMFGQEVDIAVAVEGGRAQGSSLFPRQGGATRIDIDTPLPGRTLERTSAFFLVPALPLDDDVALGFDWFTTYTDQVVPIVAEVVGREEVTTKAGSFSTWVVDLRGGTPSQRLWISRGDASRIVRMEVNGQPWVYELVSVREGGPG